MGQFPIATKWIRLKSPLTIVNALNSTRVSELRYLLDEPQRIGTLVWRWLIYEETFRQLSAATVWHVLFGHGTASGAAIGLAADPSKYSLELLDPNRVIHNEFLRALFEWGLVGLVLFCGFVLGIARVAIWPAARQLEPARRSLFAVLPMFLLSLLIENVFASAGSGWGVGFALVLGAYYSEFRKNVDS